MFVLNFCNILSFISKGIFLINFSHQSNAASRSVTGGYVSALFLLIPLIYVFYKEIIQKLIFIAIDKENIKIRTLLGKRTFAVSDIKSVTERKTVVRFSSKNRMLEVNMGNDIFNVFELYVENYNDIKEALNELKAVEMEY